MVLTEINRGRLVVSLPLSLHPEQAGSFACLGGQTLTDRQWTPPTGWAAGASGHLLRRKRATEGPQAAQLVRITPLATCTLTPEEQGAGLGRSGACAEDSQLLGMWRVTSHCGQ
jgi:hypothetical protein